jgi:hypothetical protein
VTEERKGAISILARDEMKYGNYVGVFEQSMGIVRYCKFKVTVQQRGA